MTLLLNMDLDECNIVGSYKTTRMVEIFKECTDTLIKLIDWLDNKEGWVVGWGGGGGCWGSTGQRFQVELTRTVTGGSPRTAKGTKYMTRHETACST